MSVYIKQLNAEMERVRAERAAHAEASRAVEIRAARDRLTPLDERLARALMTIPIELQKEGLSLTSLQTMLKGRNRGRAHPGELGEALRRRGWTRKRSWRGGDAGFAARWHPPNVNNHG